MKVIHKIRWIKKLSTLKHSWNLDDSALKHSCFCAETLLPLYIYIYLLYKNQLLGGLSLWIKRLKEYSFTIYLTNGGSNHV